MELEFQVAGLLERPRTHGAGVAMRESDVALVAAMINASVTRYVATRC